MKGLFAGVVVVALVAGFWLLQQQPEPLPPRLQADTWQAFSEQFVEASGRVVDRDNGGISHSEGQGYGLLFAQAADDRQAFERIWQWTQTQLQRQDGLFSWKYSPCPEKDASCISDPNNASDAEILIAWALLRAADRWQVDEYREAADRIARAASDKLLLQHQGQLLLLPGELGFIQGEAVTLNPSYWVFPALDALAKAFPEQAWQQLAEQSRTDLRKMASLTSGLAPDWVALVEGEWQASSLFPWRYGFDAVRVPLHLAWSQEGISEQEAEPYLTFWQNHSPPPAWISLSGEEQADYAWSRGMQAVSQVVTALSQGQGLAAEDLIRPDATSGYYAWSLFLLSQLALADKQQESHP
ncbi:glycosyl hydrolase family 8 [Marinospirillum perlucidum]|uniref:glycosyl hydrolase family 8 n=1 Tax=Marinospirillum perlucidum TaxID=1982602 RepID=UPI000DF2DAE0|nr:glycosyl hydrolase family 8 [Marinospirillum perlucidum]